MKNDLKMLGQTLQARRNELNFSLKEAENATSIRISHLQALEEGDLSKLISPVYAQGFYKQYANFLGLDGDKLVRENIEAFAKPEKQEFAYGIGTLEARGSPGSGVRLVPNAIWFGAFAAVGIVAYYLAKSFNLI